MNRNRWSIVTVIAICLLAATSSSQIISDAKADPTDPIPSTEPTDPPLIDPLDDPIVDPLDDPTVDPLDDPTVGPMGGPTPEFTSASATVTGDNVVVTGTVVGDITTLVIVELSHGAQATIAADGSFFITCSDLVGFAYIQATDDNGASEIIDVLID